MNWKWYIGSKASSAVQTLISRPFFPLTRYFPRGVYWMYDAQRFAGTKKLKVIFDVGANTGQTATAFVQYFPESSIYSFEPVASSFEALAKNNEKFPHVTCVHKALGAAVGETEIQLHENSELNTLVNDGGPRDADLIGETETVSIDTVDAFCAEEGLGHLDILKMDVQGWEMEVLKGARSLIEENKVRFVFSEVGFRHADSDMQHFAEINDYMEENHFRLCGFYDPFRWGDNKEYLGFANAMYINPEFNADR